MNISKIIKEEIEDFNWVSDISDKKHKYTVVLLNQNEDVVELYANSIDDMWREFFKDNPKGLDPMLLAIDDKTLKGFGGIEPKADRIRKMYESTDFDWIKETPPYALGEFFEERDSICFDDGSKLQHMTCDVNISNDKIVFNVDKEDWLELMDDIYEEDMWYLGPLLEYGSDYTDNNDYYEFDDDELNYIGHHFSDEQKDRLQKILDVVSPNTDLDEYIDDQLIELPKVLNYDPLKKMWWNFGDDVLHQLGYVIQKNRWLSIGREYQAILDSKPGVEFDLSFDGDLAVTVPMKYVTERTEVNLTNILYGVSSILERSWQDWFYDEYDTSGIEEDIGQSIDDFLNNAEKFLTEDESFDDYREYDKLVKSMGFSSSDSRRHFGYTKKRTDGHYWALHEPNLETQMVTLRLLKNLWSFRPERSWKIPINQIGEYINNYKLDLDESTDFDWIKDEEPLLNPKQLRVGDTFRYNFRWHDDKTFDFTGVDYFDGDMFKVTSRKPRTKVDGGGIEFTFFKVDENGDPVNNNRHQYHTGTIFFYGGNFTLVKSRPPVLGVDDY